MKTLSLDQRKTRLASIAKWGVGFAGAILIAPFVFLAVQGIVGLVAATFLGLAIVHGAPVMSMKFANWKLKAVKAEAARNPVETMQVVLQEKRVAVGIFGKRVEDYATEVKNFESRLAGFKRDFPGESPKFEETLSTMKRGLEHQNRQLGNAHSELNRYSDEIRKVGAIWQMSQAANKLHRAAGMTEDSFMQKIKTETAIDAVESDLNRALAQLETSLAQDTLSLENKPATTIDVRSVEVLERVRQ